MAVRRAFVDEIVERGFPEFLVVRAQERLLEVVNFRGAVVGDVADAADLFEFQPGVQPK